jgi:hypothetical protein
MWQVQPLLWSNAQRVYHATAESSRFRRCQTDAPADTLDFGLIDICRFFIIICNFIIKIPAAMPVLLQPGSQTPTTHNLNHLALLSTQLYCCCAMILGAWATAQERKTQ